MAVTPGRGSETRRQLDAILRDRQLRILFQPLVDLGSGQPFGCEALVRGPADTPLTSASALLEAAYQADRVVEFDWLARAAACRAALAGGVPRGAALFINIEPLALDSECPHEFAAPIERAYHNYRVVLEVTERSLEREPRALLDGLVRARSDVAGIALDDVGGEPATVAMLPLVEPSVIKVDRGLTRAGITTQTAAVADTIREESQRTGAIILAEGIENHADLSHARSLGAVAGQGYLYGPAVAQLPSAEAPSALLSDTPRPFSAEARPGDVLDDGAVGQASAATLTVLTNYFAQRTRAVPGGMFLVDLPDEVAYQRLSPALTDLARAGVKVAAPSSRPGAGIGSEWSAVALGCGYAAALVGRLASGGEYEFAVMHDRDRVIELARYLYRRLGRP